MRPVQSIKLEVRDSLATPVGAWANSIGKQAEPSRGSPQILSY